MATISAGNAQIDRMITQIRGLKRLVVESAPDVAKMMERTLAANIKKAIDPYGKPWKPTLSGDPPLDGAMKAIRVRAIETVVVVTLTGIEILHHFGRARGGIQRMIIPIRKIPDAMNRGIIDALTRRFQAMTEAGA